MIFLDHGEEIQSMPKAETVNPNQKRRNQLSLFPFKEPQRYPNPPINQAEIYDHTGKQKSLFEFFELSLLGH